MEYRTFLKVVGNNFNIKDLAEIVQQKYQQKFYDRIKAGYRDEIVGKPWNCFDWGYRTFNSMKHLLMSAGLYVQSKILRDRCMDVLVCYGIYYSLFHASFSLLSLHPQIKLNHLRGVKHNFLINEIKSKFIQTKVLPPNFIGIIEDWRFLRELTSYFAMLGGLQASSFKPLKDYLTEIADGVYENLKLAFQLSGFMGFVLWNVQGECKKINKEKCEKFQNDLREQKRKYGMSLEQHLESLFEYPTTYAFKCSKYSGSRFAFDSQDSWMINKLGLNNVCPRMLLYYETKTTGANNFGWLKSDEVREEFDKFLREVW